MTDDIDRARNAIEAWHLGQTSVRYESGETRSASRISSGRGDHGGVSYGAYQLSSKSGTLQEYLSQSRYGEQFKGLTPVTPAFNAKWVELATSDPGFAQDQHDFIGRSHFNRQEQKLASQGIDLSSRGPAVQDALWSTSVQFRELTPVIFSKGLEEKFGPGYSLDQLSDRDIVEAAQDYKIANNSRLFASSSPEVQQSTLSRAYAKKADLLALADYEETLQARGTSVTPSIHNTAQQSTRHLSRQTLELHSHGRAVAELQSDLRDLGYGVSVEQLLAADGKFGPATKAAVEAYQRDHDLVADGKAGPTTLGLLQEQRKSLNDPRNPDHALFAQARRAVHQVDAQIGRASDHYSDNLAASLTVAAKQEGFTRIDHVVLSDDGSTAFAVQGSLQSLSMQVAHVQTAQAVNTSVQQSSEAMQRVNQQLHAQQAERSQPQTPLQAPQQAQAQQSNAPVL